MSRPEAAAAGSPGHGGAGGLAGLLLCFTSATAFGALGVFGVFIMRNETSRATMIMLRFATAAAALWLAVLLGKRQIGRGRQVWQPLLMGAGPYALMSIFYFITIGKLSAGMAALLLYTMPIMVVLGSIARGRQRLTVKIVLALVLAVGGGVLTLGGGDTAVSVIGVLTGLASGVSFTLYYFAMDALPPRTDRLTASTLVCTGAALSTGIFGGLLGQLNVPGAGAWGWIMAIGLVCTATGIGLLMLGIEFVGPSVASLVSCMEPISAVLLGAWVLHEELGPSQWLGATMVIAAVVLLSLPSRVRGSKVERPPVRT